MRRDPHTTDSVSPAPVVQVLAVLIALLVAGCSPTYVLRAGYEEAKILWRREPIATVSSGSLKSIPTRKT